MSCYLVDFALYTPPDEYRVIKEVVEVVAKDNVFYSPEVEAFARKIQAKSGLSDDHTFLPKCVHPCFTNNPDNSITAGWEEAEEVMIASVQGVLDRTGLQPSDIDILVTSCSIFCPTPSLASMLVNHFKFNDDIQSWHISGMGCGAGVVGIAMVRDILKAHPNSNALFVPCEVVGYGFYKGKQLNRMLANIIFRMGGGAVLLSNKESWRARGIAKYRLYDLERVCTAADDKSLNCMHWGPDEEGHHGMYLSYDLVAEASKALESALHRITPRLMSVRQWGQAVVHEFRRRMLKEKLPPYMPDYTQIIDHFAIHAGGYAVLKGVQEGMGLPAHTMIPCFAALRDYGNTSGSTTWYTMSYLETCHHIRKGDKLMQVGMGGGMKVGINIWQALRDIHDLHPAWAHLHGRALTEDDLPRHIQAVGPEYVLRRRQQLEGHAGSKPGKEQAQPENGLKAASSDEARHHFQHPLKDANADENELVGL